MSRIFQSGSGIPFESVRFHDLERSGSATVYAPKAAADPGTKKKGADALPEAPADAREPARQKPIDLEAVREEAFSKGKKAGRLEAEMELHTAAQALARALEQVSRMRESLLVRSKEDMVRLVMGVARQVIQAEIAEKEEIVVGTVTRALQSAVESDEYYIRVHPDDLTLVSEQEPLFLAAMKGLRNVHFIADETVSRGGCLAESRAGDVDATIESQLNEIDAHLRRQILP